MENPGATVDIEPLALLDVTSVKVSLDILLVELLIPSSQCQCVVCWWLFVANIGTLSQVFIIYFSLSWWRRPQWSQWQWKCLWEPWNHPVWQEGLSRACTDALLHSLNVSVICSQTSLRLPQLCLVSPHTRCAPSFSLGEILIESSVWRLTGPQTVCVPVC